MKYYYKWKNTSYEGHMHNEHFILFLFYNDSESFFHIAHFIAMVITHYELLTECMMSSVHNTLCHQYQRNRSTET